ncbi:hypothetical protein D3C83_170720 [compost metagenome]
MRAPVSFVRVSSANMMRAPGVAAFAPGESERARTRFAQRVALAVVNGPNPLSTIARTNAPCAARW